MELFENILNNTSIRPALKKPAAKILFQFLDKVGILWLTNHINPERSVSNVIRQKIIAGINALSTKTTSSEKVCLFLPAAEYHELSLLFAAFLLKKKGIPVIYPGANIAFDELKTITTVKKTSYLYTHITTASQGFNPDKFLSIFSKEFRNYSTIISRRLINSYVKKIPPKVMFKKSPGEVKEFISGL